MSQVQRLMQTKGPPQEFSSCEHEANCSAEISAPHPRMQRLLAVVEGGQQQQIWSATYSGVQILQLAMPLGEDVRLALLIGYQDNFLDGKG